MPNRTRRPKIKSDDLQVAGLYQRNDEPPRWERDLVGPFLEKLLRLAPERREARDGSKR
jgi:hypothetical protein